MSPNATDHFQWSGRTDSLIRIGLSLLLTIYLSLPLLTHAVQRRLGGERNLSENIFSDSWRSFLNGWLPLWNPFYGPGGTHTTMLAFVPWDYHFLLSRWVSTDERIIFDIFLITTAFLFSLRFFRINSKIDLWIGLVAVLFYFDGEFIRYFVSYFFENAIYIVTPIVFALIYGFESDAIGYKPFTVGFSLALIFAASGSKIEIWLFQLPIACGLWVIACRFAQGSAWVRNRRNAAYAVALAAFLVATSWQSYLLTVQILETGRVHGTISAGAVRVVGDFFRSFSTSASFQIAGLVFCITGIGRLSIRQNVLPIAIGAGCAAMLGLNLRGVTEDFSWIAGRWDAMAAAAGAIATGFIIRCTHRDRSERLIITAAYGLLVWAVLALLFEDPRTWNWGHLWFAQIPSFPFLLFIACLLAALFTSRRNLLIALIGYLALFTLVRNHLSLAGLEGFGIIWHVQRDTAFFLEPLCLVFVLGAEVLVTLAKRPIDSWMPRRVNWLQQAVAILVLLGLLPGMRTLLFRDDYGHDKVKSNWEENASYVFKPSFPAGIRLGFFINGFESRNWAPMSVFSQRLQDASLYGSTISIYSRQALDGDAAEQDLAGPCNLNFLWFPNNLQRIFSCTTRDRVAKYLRIIEPSLNVHDAGALRRIGLDYLVDSRMLAPPFERVGDNDPVIPVATVNYVFNNAGAYIYRPPQLGRFGLVERLPDAAIPKATQLAYQTNLFAEPALKDRFNIDFDLVKAGTVWLRQTYSKLWDFTLNGAPLNVRPDPYGYVTFKATAGINRLQARYAPNLVWLLVISGATEIGLLAYGIVLVASRNVPT